MRKDNTKGRNFKKGLGKKLESLKIDRESTTDKTRILNYIQRYYKDIYTSLRIEDEDIDTNITRYRMRTNYLRA
jgi:hypothetical protein